MPRVLRGLFCEQFGNKLLGHFLRSLIHSQLKNSSSERSQKLLPGKWRKVVVPSPSEYERPNVSPRSIWNRLSLIKGPAISRFQEIAASTFLIQLDKKRLKSPFRPKKDPLQPFQLSQKRLRSTIESKIIIQHRPQSPILSTKTRVLFRSGVDVAFDPVGSGKC